MRLRRESEIHHQYLQLKEVSKIIKDYVHENYEDEKIKKERMENYLKLRVSTIPFESFSIGKRYHEVRLFIC